MKQIKCTRNTTYGLGGGQSADFKAGKTYEIGKGEGQVTEHIAIQMLNNRTAVAIAHTPVEENKSINPVDETKSIEEMSKKELVAYAKAHEVSINQSNSKQRILEEIQAAQGEAESTADTDEVGSSESEEA